MARRGKARRGSLLLIFKQHLYSLGMARLGKARHGKAWELPFSKKGLKL